MKSITSYKGYMARIEFDERDEIFVGKVLGIAESITFHGETVRELKGDFQAAIDHYIADCAATGRTPLKTASGKMMLRISPETHTKALIIARASGKSLNQWVEEILDRATQENGATTGTAGQKSSKAASPKTS
ncbi:MAG TPA: type II toxin-antitoxin system HicB family antitoxin [Syntrophorhabdaceae bacterium]